MNKWKLVPCEPTPEMAAVFIPESCKTGSWIDGYKAMLSAAPAPDVQPAIYPEEAREMGLEEVSYYSHPPAAASVQPVAKVHVHKTGGNAGVQWSAVAVNGYDSLPLLEDGTLLYLAPPAADVQELVEALRRLEEVASDCDIGYMDNAVRHARVVLDKWEGK